MGAFPEVESSSDKSLTLASHLSPTREASCTKRVAELEARIARLRSELEEAEAELERERLRLPAPGDFVRCPMTNFYGRVTKVTPRPHGRPWVEIVPYLGPDLPGHSAMDLFDSWELIDPPAAAATDGGSPRLPTIAPFMTMKLPSTEQAPDVDDLEDSLKRLLRPSTGAPF